MSWEEIRRLQDEYGFIPLPCPAEAGDDGKHPYVDWTDYRETPPSPRETKAWFHNPRVGVWTVLGPLTGWVNLDTDNEAGEALWRSRIGDLMDRTTCVRTRKGYHYYFTLVEGEKFNTWNWRSDPEAKELGAHFDVLGHGNGAMLPPSYFPDGPADDGREQYEWVRGPECALPLPPELQKPSKRTQKVPGEHGGRSTLAGLLADPPAEGGRNNWHNKVSGHLAKLMPFEDGFLALAKLVNYGTPQPLDDEELVKTWKSAWSAEKDKGHMGTADTGWLSSDGRKLYTVVRTKDDDDRTADQPYPFINGDIRVTGVNEGTDGTRAYEVVITREDGTQATDVVKPERLATGAARWLGGFGMSAMAPPSGKTDVAGKAGVGDRLIRFFESQKPPRFKTVQCLGWNAETEMFLTHTGAILGIPGETGLSPFNGVRPDPSIIEHELISVRYGFDADEQEALDVLREVMHFHFEDFTAVFASFCVASVLKGQMEPLTNVWPYPIVEAPSGSSKSSGFIPMIQQLIGRKGKAGTFTKAAARDALGAHRGLPEWIDDPDDLTAVKELLRLCSSEGTSKRKGGIDFRKNIVTELVQTPIITAESVNLLDQKAYADRAISLTLKSPQTRVSRHSPQRPQIDDIDDLRAKYHGDLSCLAGHVVSAILQRRSLVTSQRFREYRSGHPGRHADKLAILKMGAFVLVDILGPEYNWIITNVDAWINGQEYDPNANRLTRKLVPDALTLLGAKSRPEHWEGQAPTPVLVKRDKHGVLALWVNLRHLAMWWHAHTKGRIEERTDTEEALTQQADALGMKGARQGEINVDFLKANYKATTGSMTNAVYRRLPDSVGERIIGTLGIQDPAQEHPRSGAEGGGVPSARQGVPSASKGTKPMLDPSTVSRLRSLRDPQ